jgi:hypothetical protein
MAGLRRPTRLLLAYANQQEAINQLVDSVPASPEQVAAATERWKAATSSLVNGGPRPPLEPEAEPVPTALEDWAKHVSTSAQFQFLLGNFRPEFAVLSISRLIAIQKFVYSDTNGQKPPNPEDLSELFRLTTPEYRLTQSATIKDEGTLSYTMASENPNLRVGGMAESEVIVTTPSGAQMPLHIFGYFATYGGPWMQVARHLDRWFLRDGYHRAYQLLKHGIDRVPCVVVSANALADLGFVRAGFVGPEVLLGDRPPRVGDFIDDNVAVDGSIIPVRKVVRIRAEEFVITSDD